MRTQLLWPLAALLSQLPAQAPSPRPTYSPPLLAQETTDRTPPQAAAASDHIANRPQQRVLFDRPQADGPLWAMGTAWKGSFDGTGFTAIPYFGTNAPRNFPLRFELAQATVGGAALPLRAGEPVETGGTVRTARGALTEVVDTHLDSLEQSFVFDTLPTRGAIAIDVRITGELQPSLLENGVRFANEFGHVDYTKAVAVDAKGQRLPLAITWTGSSAHMEIPASFVERAQLPIVLDPVLNSWYGLASGVAQLQSNSDVASFQNSGGRTLIIYQRQFSANDGDCWGILFDGALNLVQTDFAIDFTSNNWKNVAVAANNYAQNFLVVAEVEGVATWWIAGRTIAANAAQGTVFDIERDGVVGVPGNSFAPDVGSDPYFGVGRYCVVFMKRPNIFSAATTIYYKQVSTAGALVSTNPTLVDTWATGVNNPSISKSCGQSNGLAANWLLTWQRTWNGAPNDQEVHGRFVNWNGAIVGTNNFGIATTVGEESRPSSGSPIDANGVRYWPMVHEYATTLGQPRDLLCKLVRGDGVTQASFTVNLNVPGADDKEPEVDSDGTRFVTTFSIGTVGFPQAVQAVTTAYLPATNTFRVDDRTGLLGSSSIDYAQTNICADYSGGGTMSPRYFISWTELASNSFHLANFGGYTGGTTFFLNQGWACGNLGISASGTPAIGQTITVTVGNGPASAVIFGVPGYIPLNALGCNCAQAVDQYVYLNNPLVWTVPNNSAFVGIPLAVQGFTVVGSQCLGFVDLSDSLVFTVR